MPELTQTPANVVKVTGYIDPNPVIAFEAVSAGMPVYEDGPSGGKYKKSRANALASGRITGMAVNSAAANQPFQIQKNGTIKPGAVLEEGETYCVSPDTAGKLVPIGDLADGDYVAIVGTAINDEDLKLCCFSPLAVKSSS